MGRNEPPDRVDRAIRDWRRTRPDLDVSPLAVIGRLKAVTEAIIAGLEKYFREHGLSLADFEILAALRRVGARERLTQFDVANRVMRTAGTITTRIDRLEKRGWVRRVEHPTDRRASHIVLTPAGRALFERIVAGHLENERQLLSGLTRSEQQTLASLLRRLLAGMPHSEK